MHICRRGSTTKYISTYIYINTYVYIYEYVYLPMYNRFYSVEKTQGMPARSRDLGKCPNIIKTYIEIEASVGCSSAHMTEFT